jgi:hypothetical protein
MITKSLNIAILKTVEVTVDESKFTDEFLLSFRERFYDSIRTVDDHIRHIAQMYARDLYDGFTTFVEGYGELKDMGISVRVTDEDLEFES